MSRKAEWSSIALGKTVLEFLKRGRLPAVCRNRVRTEHSLRPIFGIYKIIDMTVSCEILRRKEDYITNV